MTDTTTDTATSTGADGSTEQLVEAYFEAWRATDDARRAELLASVFSDDGRHVDPMADAIGVDELAAMVAGVRAAYPGSSLERTSGIDQHGDQLRFTWRLAGADGATVVDGLDVAELAPDGRLARVAAFWGDLPAR